MDRGHTTEECYHLTNKVEHLIRRGYLAKFVAKDNTVLVVNGKSYARHMVEILFC